MVISYRVAAAASADYNLKLALAENRIMSGCKADARSCLESACNRKPSKHLYRFRAKAYQSEPARFRQMLINAEADQFIETRVSVRGLIGFVDDRLFRRPLESTSRAWSLPASPAPPFNQRKGGLPYSL